jgi:hypothetical protein
MKTTETTTQHTPGPWLAGQTITAADPDRAPGSYERITIASRVNNMANARLISAAPELLAACRMALDSIPESVACFNAANEAEATRPTVLESYLRAAIAKATGGGL